MMPAPQKSMALLDLDGTLIDSREGITNCIRYALEKLGAAIPSDDRLAQCIGPPLQLALAELLGSTEERDGAEALRLYRERYANIDICNNTLYPGIREMLCALRDSGLALCLATSKPTVYAERILAHHDLSRFFSGIHGSELDGRRTRKDELISYVIAKEKLDPLRAVMVGDRSQDIEGAHANAMKAIGVTWGFGSRDELTHAGADALCDRPPDLAETLLRV